MKFGCSFGIFLISANLICRSTDISKCFGRSLRLRDNESRLYLLLDVLLVCNFFYYWVFLLLFCSYCTYVCHNFICLNSLECNKVMFVRSLLDACTPLSLVGAIELQSVFLFIFFFWLRVSVSFEDFIKAF